LLDVQNNIRIIDFGFSNTFTSENPAFSTACGSPAYAAPEVIKGEQYTASADIWSAGVLLYALTVGRTPHEDDRLPTLLQKIVFTEIVYPEHLSPALLDLLKKILVKNPSARIGLEGIRQHHWFSRAAYEAARLKVSKSNPIGEAGVDREIVDQIMTLGVDCRQLAEQVIAGVWTDLTSLYKQYQRQKLVRSSEGEEVHEPNSGDWPFGTHEAQGQPVVRSASASWRDRPRTQSMKPIPLRRVTGNVDGSPGLAIRPSRGQVPAPVAMAARKLVVAPGGIRKVALPSPPPNPIVGP
jgi:serine/threonine protein kinase